MYTKHLSKQQDQFLCAGPHHAIIWIIRWITPYNLHSLEYCQQEKVENLHALKIYLESKAFCQLSWQLFSEWKLGQRQHKWVSNLCNYFDLNYALPNLMRKYSACLKNAVPFLWQKRLGVGQNLTSKRRVIKLCWIIILQERALKLEVLLMNYMTLGKLISMVLIISVHKMRSLELMIFNVPLKFLYLGTYQFLKWNLRTDKSSSFVLNWCYQLYCMVLTQRLRPLLFVQNWNYGVPSSPGFAMKAPGWFYVRLFWDDTLCLQKK